MGSCLYSLCWYDATCSWWNKQDKLQLSRCIWSWLQPIWLFKATYKYSWAVWFSVGIRPQWTYSCSHQVMHLLFITDAGLLHSTEFTLRNPRHNIPIISINIFCVHLSINFLQVGLSIDTKLNCTWSWLSGRTFQGFRPKRHTDLSQR